MKAALARLRKYLVSFKLLVFHLIKKAQKVCLQVIKAIYSWNKRVHQASTVLMLYRCCCFRNCYFSQCKNKEKMFENVQKYSRSSLFVHNIHRPNSNIRIISFLLNSLNQSVLCCQVCDINHILDVISLKGISIMRSSI